MSAMEICGYLWVAFFVIWVLWAIKTKPTQSREPISSRTSYIIFTFAAYFLMFSGDVTQPWLRQRLFAPTPLSNGLGVAITLAGILFACWARFYLGGNWSGAVTVKVDHQLVRSGPYRWVRHPIYTGLISAMVGTAIARHQVRGLLAVVLAYVGFKIKSKIEERTMVSTFGTAYDDYSRTTGAIVPKLRF
jgi:protein-S-isoprenylcysteine O-methyltransferase Ste14